MPWARESTFLYQYIKVWQPTKNKKEFQSPYQETNKFQFPPIPKTDWCLSLMIKNYHQERIP